MKALIIQHLHNKIHDDDHMQKKKIHDDQHSTHHLRIHRGELALLSFSSLESVTADFWTASKESIDGSTVDVYYQLYIYLFKIYFFYGDLNLVFA